MQNYEWNAKKKKNLLIIGLVLLLVVGTIIGVVIYQNRGGPTKSQSSTPPPEVPDNPPIPDNKQFGAIVANKQEPEYKENPYLPISSVGTDYTTANETNLPYGSALMTDTLDGSGKGMSQLHSKGITHIIHAAPKSEGKFTNRDDFIQQAVKAVQNCIFLVDRKDIQTQVKIDKLAICFVGGGIFCNEEGTKPLLAEGIIKGALNQIEKCQNLKEIIFVSFMGANDKRYYLEDAWKKVEKDNDFKEKMEQTAKIERGDIREKSVHGASVIVNAANTYVGFGGGISGAIKSQVGDKTKIEVKAKELIRKFNSKIKK